MRFYFPDSQDQVDPGFDFIAERRSPFRLRQRDDLYAHEALSRSPFSGLLVSKPIVDGMNGASGRYTIAQRHRLYRLGVREFFRLDSAAGPRIATMGDCGAFSYVSEEHPPYTVDEVIDFYDEGRFDAGLSIDHVILGFQEREDPQLPGVSTISEEWERRRQLTLDLARDFIRRWKERKCSFTPVGVAQGYSPRSYADSVSRLQRLGYERIALGGMVPLKTPEILATLRAASRVRKTSTQFHLLGVTRCENLEMFETMGVTSFDSTSPFRQAFMDDRDNYYTLAGTHTALRVPQVDGNAKLKRKILSGEVDQRQAIDLETKALKLLRGFDQEKATASRVLGALREYDLLYDGRRDRTVEYRAFLEKRPWKTCGCGLCGKLGIEIAIFRGTERNKSRGFHNLFVFGERFSTLRGSRRVPAAAPS